MLDIYALMVRPHHPYPKRERPMGKVCLVMVGNAVAPTPAIGRRHAPVDARGEIDAGTAEPPRRSRDGALSHSYGRAGTAVHTPHHPHRLRFRSRSTEVRLAAASSIFDLPANLLIEHRQYSLQRSARHGLHGASVLILSRRRRSSLAATNISGRGSGGPAKIHVSRDEYAGAVPAHCPESTSTNSIRTA